MKKITLILISLFTITSLLSCGQIIKDNNLSNGSESNSNSNNLVEEIFSNIFDKESNNHDVDFSKLTYTAIGDSLTEGSLLEDGSWNLGYSYPEVVHNLLGLKRTTNLGKSGSTFGVGSSPMYERYKTIPMDSDIISVAGGNNDAHTFAKELGTIDDLTAYTFYGGLNITISGIKRDYPKAFVFLISMGPCGGTNELGVSCDTYTNAMKEIANKYDIPFLNIHNNEGLIADTREHGNSHPSTEAVETITGPLVADLIKEHYCKN